MTPIQEEIYKAIKQMSEKVQFTEAVIAKKVRENTKLEGKKKAGLSLADIMAATNALADENIFYSIHINSVNECLLKKEDEFKELSLEAKQRRQKSEKSIILITSNDIGKNIAGKSKGKKEKRSERTKMSIYDDYN